MLRAAGVACRAVVPPFAPKQRRLPQNKDVQSPFTRRPALVPAFDEQVGNAKVVLSFMPISAFSLTGHPPPREVVMTQPSAGKD